MHIHRPLSLLVAAAASLACAQQRDAPLANLDGIYVNRTVTSGLNTQASPLRTTKLTIHPNGTYASVEDSVKVGGRSLPGLRARGPLTPAEVERLRVAIEVARLGATPESLSGPARDPGEKAFDILVFAAPMPYRGRVRGLINYVNPAYSEVIVLALELDRIEDRLRKTQVAATHGFVAFSYTVGNATLVVRSTGEIVLRDRVFSTLYIERSARLFAAEVGQFGVDLERARVGDLPRRVSPPGARGEAYILRVAAPGDVGGAVYGLLGPVPRDFQISPPFGSRLIGLLLNIERTTHRLRRGSMAGGVRVRLTR